MYVSEHISKRLVKFTWMLYTKWNDPVTRSFLKMIRTGIPIRILDEISDLQIYGSSLKTIHRTNLNFCLTHWYCVLSPIYINKMAAWCVNIDQIGHI